MADEGECREECSWKCVKDDIRLSSPPQSDFLRSQWDRDSPKVSLPYLIFRFFVLLFFVVGTSLRLSCSTGDARYYLIALTNLNFTVQGVYAAFYFGRMLWLWFAGTKDVPPGSLPWPERVIWVLFNIILSSAFIVSLGYWVILFRPAHYKEIQVNRECRITADIMVHAFNSPVAILDLFVMKVPIHITHAVFPIIYGFCYILIAGLYQIWGDSIYGIFRWRHYPLHALFNSVIALMCAGLFHLIFAYLVYCLRKCIHEKCSKRKGTETQALLAPTSEVQTEEIGADAIESNAEMGEDRPPNYNTIEKV